MPAGLYLHVPFCVRKCRYCDFVSHPCNPADAGLYAATVPLEAKLRAARLPPEKRGAATAYVGGGTPTVLPAPVLAALLEKVRAFFPWPDGAEVTVEANPGTVRGKGLEILRRAGVSRLSLGMQAAQDRLLVLLGRVHSFADTREAVRLAREAGFADLNLDLIYGLPEQSLADWRATLEAAVALGPEHISAYALELHPATPLAEMVRRGEVRPCPEELDREMYDFAREFLARNGYEQYEIANFARPGHACRHNLIYWENGEYVGLGPGAHTHLGAVRQANEARLPRWAARVRAGELPVAEEERPDTRTQMAETVFLGLRLTVGLDRRAFRARFGRDVLDVYGAEVRRLAGRGLLEITASHLRLTPAATPVANEVFAAFLP
ncbi:MAG: radical SAM family heme chaperone HemW [Bacillota bacterium]